MKIKRGLELHRSQKEIYHLIYRSGQTIELLVCNQRRGFQERCWQLTDLKLSCTTKTGVSCLYSIKLERQFRTCTILLRGNTSEGLSKYLWQVCSQTAASTKTRRCTNQLLPNISKIDIIKPTPIVPVTKNLTKTQRPLIEC